MAWEEQQTFNRISCPCNGTNSLATKQFCAVTIGSGGVMDVATAAKGCTGILQDNPAVNVVGTIARDGISKAAIALSQTLVGGVTLLEVAGSSGFLCAHTSGVVVARAMENVTSTAAVVYSTVEILRNAPTGTAFS